MIAGLKPLVRSGDLLREWTNRMLRARYEQSVLGWLWAIVQPAAQAAVFTVIFTRLVPVETGGTPYAAFVYIATTCWTFLATSLADMTSVLVDNMNLVNKIYFPRETLPLACLLARLADLGVGAALFVAIGFYFDVPFFPLGLAVLPVILMVQILLVAGIGLACAALNVFTRDVRPLLVLVTQLWMYASPVIYPLDAVPAPFRAAYSLNPMVGVIESFRDVLLRGRMPGEYLVTAGIVASSLFIAGYWLFKRVEFRFADVV